LAAGKGVVIAENAGEARRTVQQFMESKSLGDAGSKLVIEEFLQGEEASFHMVFADGRDFQTDGCRSRYAPFTVFGPKSPSKRRLVILSGNHRLKISSISEDMKRGFLTLEGIPQ